MEGSESRDESTGGVRPASVASEPTTADFDWRGWALVAAIVVAFLVVPAAILYLPSARGLVGSLGLTVRDAYLVLPLLPAFGLGAIAVWSAMHARSQ